MAYCADCGTLMEEGKKFCRLCGMPLDASSEDAATWRLPSDTWPTSEPQRPTTPVKPNPTAPSDRPVDSFYTPPINYHPPPGAMAHQPPPETRSAISLGDWLSGGWRVYQENWLLMSIASLIGAFLSVCTAGILAGPMLMGLYSMAFKTMRGERPQMNDLFNWEGKFLQSFLAFLIAAAIYGGLTGAGQSGPLSALLGFAVGPLLTIMLAFVLPLILERKSDIADAINKVGRLIFSKDALMWWVVGLVFATITWGGFFGLCIGFFITLPWMVSSAAVAYNDIFGIDDPNRTLH